MAFNKQVKILIIEDDVFLNGLYVKKFSDENYKVFSAFDGEKGIKIAKEKKPDLILLDLVLPKMSGFDVIKKLKSGDCKNILIILLTNLSEKENIEKALSLGVEDYLIKVYFTPSEIVEKIKKVLSKKH
ncbi:MAG: response regulator [Xanthomonadaceae bacterium]|nr:response regulator [Rhodospirillaceae bacterium]NIA17645.1 response regulator [Xanthomonadaceae bacterium]